MNLTLFILLNSALLCWLPSDFSILTKVKFSPTFCSFVPSNE